MGESIRQAGVYPLRPCLFVEPVSVLTTDNTKVRKRIDTAKRICIYFPQCFFGRLGNNLYLCVMIMKLVNFFFGYYSATPVSSLSKREMNKIVKLTMEYCETNLGVNSRKELPTVVLAKNPHDSVYYGEYCPTYNEIRVFVDEIATLGSVTATLIHEYTHYLQPIASKYYKMLAQYGYQNHPFEIEARNNEKIYNRRVLHYIRKKTS